MKNTIASGKAAKKNPTTASKPNTARVCIKTSEIIQFLADEYNQPPALIAGALAEIGCNLLGQDDMAEIAGATWQHIALKVIHRETPKPKCFVPVLTSEWVAEVSQEWIVSISRPKDEWLGQMIELGVTHYQNNNLVRSAVANWQTAFFLTACFEIRGDWQGVENAAELLKPAPKAPPALVSFARHLIEGKGDAA